MPVGALRRKSAGGAVHNQWQNCGAMGLDRERLFPESVDVAAWVRITVQVQYCRDVVCGRRFLECAVRLQPNSQDKPRAFIDCVQLVSSVSRIDSSMAGTHRAWDVRHPPRRSFRSDFVRDTRGVPTPPIDSGIRNHLHESIDTYGETSLVQNSCEYSPDNSVCFEKEVLRFHEPRRTVCPEEIRPCGAIRPA